MDFNPNDFKDKIRKCRSFIWSFISELISTFINKHTIDSAFKFLKKFIKICFSSTFIILIILIVFIIISFAMFAILEDQGVFDDVQIDYGDSGQLEFDELTGQSSLNIDFDEVTQIISKIDFNKLRDSEETIASMIGSSTESYLYDPNMSAFTFLRMYSLFAEICSNDMITGNNSSITVTPGILMAVLKHESGLMPLDENRAYHADTGKTIAQIGSAKMDPYLLYRDILSYAAINAGNGNTTYAGLFGTNYAAFGEIYNKTNTTQLSSGVYMINGIPYTQSVEGTGIPVCYVSQVESPSKISDMWVATNTKVSLKGIPQVGETEVMFRSHPKFSWAAGIQRPSGSFLADNAATTAYFFTCIRDGKSVYTSGYSDDTHRSYIDKILAAGGSEREATVAVYFETRAGLQNMLYGEKALGIPVAKYLTGNTISSLSGSSFDINRTGYSSYNAWFASADSFRSGLCTALGIDSVYTSFTAGLSNPNNREMQRAFSDPFYILVAEQLFTKTAKAVAQACANKFAYTEVPGDSGAQAGDGSSTAISGGFSGQGKAGWSSDDANFDGKCDKCGTSVTWTDSNLTPTYCSDNKAHDMGLKLYWPTTGSRARVTSFNGTTGCRGFHYQYTSNNAQCNLSVHQSWGHLAYDIGGDNVIAIASGVARATTQKSYGNRVVLYVVSNQATLKSLMEKHSNNVNSADFLKDYIANANFTVSYCHMASFDKKIPTTGLSVTTLGKGYESASECSNVVYVKAGDVLGTVGASGSGAGYGSSKHLHMGIKNGGSYREVKQTASERNYYVDFLPYLKSNTGDSWLALRFGSFERNSTNLDSVCLGFTDKPSHSGGYVMTYLYNSAYVTG